MVCAEGSVLQQALLRDLSAQQAECGLAEFASALGQFGASARAATEDAQRSPHWPSADRERIKRTMEGRFAGASFREIAAVEGLSTATVHRLYWKTIRSCPHDPARLRRLATRERNALTAGM